MVESIVAQGIATPLRFDTFMTCLIFRGLNAANFGVTVVVPHLLNSRHHLCLLQLHPKLSLLVELERDQI